MKPALDVYCQKPISVDVDRRPSDARRRAQAQARRADRHATPQHAAPDRSARPHHSRGQARQIGLRRDLLLLPHARHRKSARHRTRPPISITKCGPAPRRCAPTTSSSIRAVGGRSWNTATASWATCASTCSTWCAGCSTSAGRRRIDRPAAFSSTRRAKRTSPTRRPRRSISATQSRLDSIAPGATLADPQYPWGATFYGDKGTLKASVMSYDFIPHGKGEKRSTRTCTYEFEQYPEDETEKDLERHVAPAIRGHMQDFLANIAIARQARRRHRARPHFDRELHPGEPLDETRPLADVGPGKADDRRRRRGQQAAAAAVSEALGASERKGEVNVRIPKIFEPRFHWTNCEMVEWLWLTRFDRQYYCAGLCRRSYCASTQSEWTREPAEMNARSKVNSNRKILQKSAITAIW